MVLGASASVGIHRFSTPVLDEWFASRQMLEVRSDSSARLGWPLEEGTKEGFGGGILVLFTVNVLFDLGTSSYCLYYFL